MGLFQRNRKLAQLCHVADQRQRIKEGNVEPLCQTHENRVESCPIRRFYFIDTLMLLCSRHKNWTSIFDCYARSNITHSDIVRRGNKI